MHEVERFLRIHARRRFVQQEQLRPGRQGPGNFQMPLQAVGQVGRQLVLFIVELKQPQQIYRFAFNPFFFLPVPADAQDRFGQAVVDQVIAGNFDIIQYG